MSCISAAGSLSAAGPGAGREEGFIVCVTLGTVYIWSATAVFVWTT